MGIVVQSRALTDNRFGTLARICGLADADHARGKMLHLWEQCRNEQTYILTEDDVVTALGEHGPDALVRARLGERADGGIRLCGTEGSVDRFWSSDAGPATDQRSPARASAGGAKRAKLARRGPDGRMLPNSASEPPASASAMEVAGPAMPSSEPAPSSLSSSSSSSSSEIPDLSHRAREAREPETPPVSLDTFRAMTDTCLTLVHVAAGRLRAEICPTAPEVRRGSGSAELLALKAVSRWAMEALDAGEEPGAAVAQRIEHVIAVRSASARAAGHLRWWAGDTFWNATTLDRDLHQTAEQAAASSRAQESREGPRRASTGRPLTGAAAARAQLEELEARERGTGT